MYYIYIIRCLDDTLYTGITTDIQRRMKQHKDGKGAKYTRSHGFKNIEAVWTAQDRSLASVLECRIKRLARNKKMLLISDNSLFSEYLKKDEKIYNRMNISEFSCI
ncbi:MAG: GIY-YIG nuclease family protein [Ruminococcus sp.]|nr:GIY-YIG nuclease family protein [Ruminococcus sp.]